MRKLLFTVGPIAGCMFLLGQNKAQTSPGLVPVKMIVTVKAGVPLEATMRGGNPEEAVRNTALRVKPDLVIVGRGDLQQPFGWLRSHA